MEFHQVNVYEAKTQLSKLIAEVEAGGAVVIARDGVPVVRLVAIAQPSRRFGTAKGENSWISDDFGAPLPEDMLADIAP